MENKNCHNFKTVPFKIYEIAPFVLGRFFFFGGGEGGKLDQNIILLNKLFKELKVSRSLKFKDSSASANRTRPY